MSLRTLSLFVVIFALVGASSESVAAKGGPSAPRGLFLTAAAVVPGPGDTDASGTFKISVGRSEVGYALTVNNVAGIINTIAIYRGEPGTSGSMVLRLSPNNIGIQGLNGYTPVTSTLGRELSRNPERFYMEVRTSAFPNGALRGQLKQ